MVLLAAHTLGSLATAALKSVEKESPLGQPEDVSFTKLPDEPSEETPEGVSSSTAAVTSAESCDEVKEPDDTAPVEPSEATPEELSITTAAAAK